MKKLSGREKRLLNKSADIIEAMEHVDVLKASIIVAHNCESCNITKNCNSCAIHNVLQKILKVIDT